MSGTACVGRVLGSDFSVTSALEETREATTHVICVPTPLRDGVPELTAAEGATRAVADVLQSGDLVVLESGSGLTAGEDFLLAYSPERIDPGNPTCGITNTPEVVSGTTERGPKAAVASYEQVVEEVVTVARPREAAMAKPLENTFRHVHIALVNEMAVFCRQLDIDLWDSFLPELVVDTEPLTSQELTAELLGGVDAVAILTRHPGVDWGLVAATRTLILDTRKRLDNGAEGVFRL